MEALSRNWGWLLAFGILMIILGLFAIGAPVMATIAVQVVLGWLLVIGGIAEAIHAFMAQNWRGFLFELLSAILYVVVGALLLFNPLLGAAALTLLLAVFLVVEGIFKIIMALRVRDHRGWGWLLASGILSLILWDLAFWIWEVQLVVFSLLSLVSVFVGRRFFVSSAASDQPLLNKIAEGRGRIRLDDTTWVVEGPDLPTGTRVRIVASNGRQLTVEPA